MASVKSNQNLPRKRRSRFRGLLFSLILFVLIAGFQEIIFRIFFPIPETTRFNRIRYQLLAESDPRFQPLFKRGLAYDKLLFESRPDGWRHIHYLNRFGFRERDFSITPVSGKNRVIVVGDSITEGQGVSTRETIPGQLGEMLGTSHEVLNLGVVAATLDKVTLLAAESAVILSPQTLVIVLYANDIPAPPAFTISSLNSIDAISAKIRKEIDTNISQSYLPQFVRIALRITADQPVYNRFFGSTIRYFAPEPDSTNPFSNQQNPNPKLSPELEQAMRRGEINPWLLQQSEAMPGMLKANLALGGSPEPFLAAVSQICLKRKIRLIVAYVPFYGTLSEKYIGPMIACGMDQNTAKALSIDPDYSHHAKDLAEICTQLKIEFVDSTIALKLKEDTGLAQFWNYDSHPNAAGYQTIADSIFKKIKPY